MSTEPSCALDVPTQRDTASAPEDIRVIVSETQVVAPESRRKNFLQAGFVEWHVAGCRRPQHLWVGFEADRIMADPCEATSDNGADVSTVNPDSRGE
jgi:hypothetical protein